MKDKIILIAEKNEIWIDIVQSFGCTKETAEDIVQEMYIKIQKTLSKGLATNIMYNGEEINYYYIFKCLNSIFIDLKRKEKNKNVILIEDAGKLNIIYQLDIEVDFQQEYDKIQKELKKMYWYDRKVFEIINSGESIAELSRKSKIPYYSLYNTYHKVKTRLKKML
jgi:DNA-directed RNA polymerase specialized sigma24 family protein